VLRWLGLIVVLVVWHVAPASAAIIHGLVYEDNNGDGQPSIGEPGRAGAVVAYGIEVFAVTDAKGQFELHIPDDSPAGIVWVRVPDGFAPGPVWQTWDGTRDIDLGLRRLPTPVRQPFTIVVAADTHMPATQTYFGTEDLAAAAREATALVPAPAFFTILGDITQGNRDAEFDHVADALADLAMPWVAVPGNHDWWDGGLTWFRRFGPDNFSFDMGGVHFVVWNMARSDDEVRAYLGAELSRVDRSMPIVALTHAPPSEAVVQVLRELHVAYLLTGHTHTNRVIDHGGLVELNTEPLLMGGLDFMPAGYRVVTIDGGKLTSYHRTVVDAPALQLIAPDRCAGAEITVATEVTAAPNEVTARVDCGLPIPLAPRGGWIWSAPMPAVGAGLHTVDITATSGAGIRATRSRAVLACDSMMTTRLSSRTAAIDWPGLGGGPDHRGAREVALAPPLALRWAAPIGGQGLQAAPAIAAGTVFVVATDLGDGATGGVTALDLATGARRWHVATAKPIRGGAAVAHGTVVVQMIDGVAIGLDAITGAERWRHALAPDVPITARTTFGTPTADGDDVAIANQRELAVLDAATGAATGSGHWTDDPVPDGVDSQSLASPAIGAGLIVGSFDRALGGVIAWDRATGTRQWAIRPPVVTAVNASPVIADGRVFIASGDDTVTALGMNGSILWRVQLDPSGFEWGYATAGTPAYAHGVLVVPTLYRDLVALDATTGAVRWRAGATPSPLRTTHYRGKDQAGFEAAPVITGDLVWAADTAGMLVARDLMTGVERGRIALGAPVLAGLAVSGDWLVAVSYDGVVHALAAAPGARLGVPVAGCSVTRSPRRPARRPRFPVLVLAAIAAGAVAFAIGRRRRRAE
jgi:outer membrane protein assembly factor BamB/predicted phosphodiesterase